MRTILIHLNIQVADGEQRSADELADAAVDLLQQNASFTLPRVSEIRNLAPIVISCPLAEEI